MANRVTVAEVQEIMEVDTTVASTTDMTAMIGVANRIVTKQVTASHMTATDLKNVELYLSAHLIAIKDKRVASEKAGSVAQSFQYKLGLRLESTMYGQQVLWLDTSGAMNALNNVKKKASMKTLNPISS